VGLGSITAPNRSLEAIRNACFLQFAPFLLAVTAEVGQITLGKRRSSVIPGLSANRKLASLPDSPPSAQNLGPSEIFDKYNAAYEEQCIERP
jgi:hypothetical protein